MDIKEPRIVKEIHAHTILQVVIAALILWVGATVSGTSTTVAVIEAQLSHVVDDMDDLDDRVKELERE